MRAENEEPAAWMVVGEIAGPFGVRGEMKVNVLTDFPERFTSLDQVFVGPDRAPRKVDRARLHGQQVVLKLQGIDDPDEVSKLRNWEIAVPRSQAVPLPEGHYFLDDLIGAMVVTTEGIEVGPISDILRTGSNDVYVVGSGRDEVLIPAVADAVAELDVAGQRVTVQPWVLLRDE